MPFPTTPDIDVCTGAYGLNPIMRITPGGAGNVDLLQLTIRSDATTGDEGFPYIQLTVEQAETLHRQIQEFLSGRRSHA